MSRRNGKPIHGGVLKPSTPDDIALAKAVEDRFLELCKVHLNLLGTQLKVPKSLDADFLRWRTMRVRHRARDHRHMEAEMQSVRMVAQWTVDEQCRLRHQEPKTIKWPG